MAKIEKKDLQDLFRMINELRFTVLVEEVNCIGKDKRNSIDIILWPRLSYCDYIMNCLEAAFKSIKWHNVNWVNGYDHKNVYFFKSIDELNKTDLLKVYETANNKRALMQRSCDVRESCLGMEIGDQIKLGIIEFYDSAEHTISEYNFINLIE